MPRSRTATPKTKTKTRRTAKPKAVDILPGWSDKADIVALTLSLTCDQDTQLYAQ